MTCGCAMGSWGGMMGPVGLVLTVGFFALLVWGGIAFVRYFSGSGADRAEDVLSRRFAAGEIDEEDYRYRLDVLHAAASDRTPWSGGVSR